MKKVLLMALVVLSFPAMAQNLQSPNSKNPKVDIKVNKEYDESGNLIKYDSVYSSTYSTFEGDSVGLDSILNEFNYFFSHSFSPIISNHFDPFFYSDSLIFNHFFDDDFFFKQYQNHDNFDEMFRDLDSLKNSFFKQYPKIY